MASQLLEVHFDEDSVQIEKNNSNRRYLPLKLGRKVRDTSNCTVQNDRESELSICAGDDLLNLKALENIPGPSTDTIQKLINRYLSSCVQLDADNNCAAYHNVDNDINIGTELCVPKIVLKRASKRTRASVQWNIVQDETQTHRNSDLPVAMCHHDHFNSRRVIQNTLGDMKNKCTHCSALKFKSESENLCCSKGVIGLPLFNTPVPEIVSLYSNKNFLKNIRAYNSVFGFTSVGASTTENLRLDHDLANARKGVYTFRIQGTMCHRIGSLQPPGETLPPSFAQIYIMDPDMERRSNYRCSVMDGLDPIIADTIERALSSYNPFARAYSSVGLEINANPDVIGLRIYESVETDLRRYNKPTASEVAGIIIGDLEAKPRDLIVFKKKGGMKRVFETWAQYDPLQYPVLFPAGELGWKTHLSYGNNIKRYGTPYITTREFYAYR